MPDRPADIGIVAIGRNEGERLRRCLESVCGRGHVVVYVDSGSTDGSGALAREMGAEVVELDLSRPFTAARGRNAGFERLMAIAPATEFVQFVDGDCEIAPQWIARGAESLRGGPELAAVAGRLRERHPEASVYNRLCDLEWDQPAGEALACGGIAMYRASCLVAVGAFDPSIASGEEPELCLRLRRRGWKIMRLADDMGGHDAAMLRFSQWWKRAVRGGYGGLDVARRFERGDGIFASQIRSARLWGVGYPLAIAVGVAVAAVVGGVVAAMVAAILAGALPAQVLRLARQGRRRGLGWRHALAYGSLLMLGKAASLVGQLRCWRDHRAGRHARLIEHKGPTQESALAPGGGRA